MHNDWLTTSEAASMLGVSRQHVVDLCERGELNCTKTGTHRRIRRFEIQRLLQPPLTREQEKSLWLHRVLLGYLMIDPENVLETARENIRNWKSVHRADGMATRYLEQWEQVIDGGVDEVVTVLMGTDEHSSELRQNSPFAGVLSEVDRRQALRSFREHWDREHAAA
ncbi:helix-turn-helix domain-containing protein [Ruania halotolerans]|uniref:helix-turn-helix domain-containing protein n=1 Tax=Ruania halotolerans TaxID=2897773 RepID=UPI001E4061A9|nr:helix-turn-helix domain-containing protein [Ruania halotolerans]UFU07960.1 helix-turn-helix domain-containing protein [Ruania halotolerans]